MPPSLALLFWLILAGALLYFDPAEDPKVSTAVWVPFVWMFIAGSRLPSQWLGEQVGSFLESQEGNPLDRTIFLFLILLAIGILMSRSFKWDDLLSRNWVLGVYLLFALVSVCWSDFPFIAFKRWFRDLGNYLVILVALSDRRPLEAIRTLLRRLCYVLMSLSVLLIKYFPQISKQYDYWTGAQMYVGPTTGKNLLGVLCFVSGLFFFWDTLTRWSDRKKWWTKRIILVNFAFIVMTLWVMNLASSATAWVCVVLGCLVITAAHARLVKSHPAFLKVLIPASFLLYLLLSFGFNMSGELASAVGKDPTLTDRTKIWGILLSMHTNPLIGTGYESFWLGRRFIWFGQTSGLGYINEAHNGYLEVYLNLGLIGLFLVAGFVVAAYRTIWRNLQFLSSFSSLMLALWIVFLFYNVTEAGFRSGFMWLVFLLGAIAVPKRIEGRVRTIAAFADSGASEKVPVFR